jgi:hypothetical protein
MLAAQRTDSGDLVLQLCGQPGILEQAALTMLAMKQFIVPPARDLRLFSVVGMVPVPAGVPRCPQPAAVDA